MREERRNDRRTSRGASLDRWLQAVAARTGVEDLVVADHGGLLVAASREGDLPHRIAAAGAKLPSSVCDALAVLRVRALENDSLRLCATGEITSRLESLLMAEPGVVRILREPPRVG